MDVGVELSGTSWGQLAWGKGIYAWSLIWPAELTRPRDPIRSTSEAPGPCRGWGGRHKGALSEQRRERERGMKKWREGRGSAGEDSPLVRVTEACPDQPPGSEVELEAKASPFPR